MQTTKGHFSSLTMWGLGLEVLLRGLAARGVTVAAEDATMAMELLNAVIEVIPIVMMYVGRVRATIPLHLFPKK